MVNSVAMIIIMEHDLEAAVDFYKQLGLHCTFQLPKKWAEFEVRGVKVGLCPTDQEPFDRRIGLVFEVDDVQQMYEQNKEKLTFVGEPIEKIHGVMVSVKDPGGNIIDLYQPTPEKVKELAKKVKEADGCGKKEDASGGCTPKDDGGCCKS